MERINLIICSSITLSAPELQLNATYRLTLHIILPVSSSALIYTGFLHFIVPSLMSVSCY